ncbi:MAG: hypothetical protein HYS45_02830 [Parcubacteria group bacterium]|nr:hypothetical protein [Parcubacteria group bacterium]
MQYSYLNLIPETQKRALKRERAFYLVHAVVGILVVVLAANGILLVIARFMLVAYVNQLKNDTSLVNPVRSTLQREIRDVNQKLEDTAAVQERFVKLTGLLADASAVLPPGVTIDFLNVDATSGTFRITGVAADRSNLLAAQEALELLAAVATLESPLSNFIEKENIIFRFSGTLVPGAYRAPQPAN